MADGLKLTCQNCRFYGGASQCRRHPPVTGVREVPSYTTTWDPALGRTVPNPPQQVWETVWPTVGSWDWCGDHELEKYVPVQTKRGIAL